MTAIRRILTVLTVLLLVSCQQQDYVGISDDAQPDAQIVIGRSLGEVDLAVVSVEEARFPNPLPDRSDDPIRCYLQLGNERLRHSETLEGSYNVIYAGMPWDGTGAELIDLMWLQAFSVKELSQSSVLVSISGITYTPQELEGFLLWQDDSAVVYDITALERKTSIDDVVDAFRARLYKAHEDALAGLPELEAMGRTSPFLDMDVENYNVEILKDMDQFLQENIGQMISKIPSE